MTLLSILAVGFLLGMKHATEADHLAAVATLVTRQSTASRTLMQGVAWGLGHTITLLLFGGVVLALGKSIPARLEQALEFGVALMLVALGADVLRRLARERMHLHVHSHGPHVTHVHAHGHANDTPGRAAPRGANRHAESPHEHAYGLPVRALAVGTMHGLAGSAGLVLLSLQAVQSWTTGLVYIAIFGVGSIAGMAVLSVAIALPLRLSAGRLGIVHGSTTAILGAFSFGLGLYLVYEIGFLGGLLSA